MLQTLRHTLLMHTPSSLYPRHRFPAEIISHCVWLYFRFNLSSRNVEEIMAVRGVALTYESVREWCLKFGQTYANDLRRRRPQPGDRWHIDEVFIKIGGRIHYLWRAVDQDGEVLGILVQRHRNKKAAKKFTRRALEGLAVRPASHRHRQIAVLRQRRKGRLHLGHHNGADARRHRRAISLLLLAGALLLATSFLRLQNQQPGFRADGVFVANLTLPAARYPDIETQSRFYLRLAEEMRRAPGVGGASLIQGLPLTGANSRSPYAAASGDAPPLKDRPLGLTRSVTPGYFTTLEIPLLAGRDFTERDVHNAPTVVIITRGTARKLFAGEEALGRRILMGTNNGVGLPMEVVGVAEDVRSQTLAQTAEVEFYRPVMQRQSAFMQLAVRTESDPAAFAATARQVLKGLDAGVPFNNPTTLDATVAQSLGQQRLLFTLLSLFAALALVLAAVGIYSVVAYTVGQRTGEIGVRMALGARPRDVLRLVIDQGMRPVLLGVAAGLAGCLALGRLIQSQLYDVSASDPLMLAATCAVLVGVAAVACWLPARRATRVNPVVALRFE